LVNGANLLGAVENRSASIMNILTGVLTFVINLISLLKANEPAAFFSVATGLLFSFTYLYVGATYIFGLDTSGLGWYCLFVGLTAIPTAFLNFFSGDNRFGVIWLIWAALWLLFFLLAGLKRQIGRLTGWATIFTAIVTCWIPGYLMLIGKW